MSVDQGLRSATSQMGLLIYVGGHFQVLLSASFGKPPIVSIIRTRIQAPPPPAR
jgi:hypothetical protein